MFLTFVRFWRTALRKSRYFLYHTKYLSTVQKSGKSLPPTPTLTQHPRKKNIQIVQLKHGETSGQKNIYLFGSDVTHDIYNYTSLILVAYCKIINPLSNLFSRMKSCHERTCGNLCLYFENCEPWEIMGSRTTFRKGVIDLEDGSSHYGIHTKILYRIRKYGEFPNVRWT